MPKIFSGFVVFVYKKSYRKVIFSLRLKRNLSDVWCSLRLLASQLVSLAVVEGLWWTSVTLHLLLAICLFQGVFCPELSQCYLFFFFNINKLLIGSKILRGQFDIFFESDQSHVRYEFRASQYRISEVEPSVNKQKFIVCFNLIPISV